MEDQFGGRTDDDLFYDDFEPVQGDTVVVDETAQPVQEPSSSTQQVASSASSTQPADSQPTGATAPLASPSKGLSQSRFAEKPAPVPASSTEQSAAPPNNAPKAPRDKNRAAQQTSSNPVARLQSGANPRQKLTDEELAAKMEKMKLLSAEKTRKFEMAEKDEKQHAAAYAKGMEEARKRRADEAERRRRGEENRKQMDDERAKNRERKLKAMSAKDSSWDEGKEAMAEEEARRGFKGANGGIRGARRGGLSGSRFAREGEENDVDRFLDERHRGRGRGRGRGGRGGRGAAAESSSNGRSDASAKQEVPKSEDFPSLPANSGKKLDSAPPAVTEQPKPHISAPVPSVSPPAGGKWDEEMEALDEAPKTVQS